MGAVRNDVAIEREHKAWLLRTQKGYTVYQIADELGVTHQAVSLILKRASLKIANTMAAAAEAQKGEQTAQLDALYSEAMRAWERSQENGERTTTRTKELGARDKKQNAAFSEYGNTAFDPEDIPNLRIDEDGEERPAEEVARMIADAADAQSRTNAPLMIVERVTNAEVKGQVGDPRFLAEAQKALQAKRDIWGLDAPAKHELSATVDDEITKLLALLDNQGQGKAS